MTTSVETIIPSTTPAGIPPKAGFDFMGLMPLALVFVVFYFLVFRPQQKKMKQQRDMLAALQRGDRVVTTSGMVGTISKIVSEAELMIEIADGLSVRFVRSAVAEVLGRTGAPTTEPKPVTPLPTSSKGVKSSPAKRAAAPKGNRK